MRAIERARQFKRDYRREAKGRHRKTPDNDLKIVVSALVVDQPLSPNYRDHALTGQGAGNETEFPADIRPSVSGMKVMPK